MKETWDPSHCYLRAYWMVLNDRSLDMILSLPLCIRPSALFHIRINFEKHRCLWGFLEQEIDGPWRGLYLRWTRKGQEKQHLCPDCHSNPQSQCLSGLHSYAACKCGERKLKTQCIGGHKQCVKALRFAYKTHTRVVHGSYVYTSYFPLTNWFS